MKKWLVNLLVFNFVFSLGGVSQNAFAKEKKNKNEDYIKGSTIAFKNCKGILEKSSAKTPTELRECIGVEYKLIDTNKLFMSKKGSLKNQNNESNHLDSLNIYYVGSGGSEKSDIYSPSVHDSKCFEYTVVSGVAKFKDVATGTANRHIVSQCFNIPDDDKCKLASIKKVESNKVECVPGPNDKVLEKEEKISHGIATLECKSRVDIAQYKNSSNVGLKTSEQKEPGKKKTNGVLNTKAQVSLVDKKEKTQEDWDSVAACSVCDSGYNESWKAIDLKPFLKIKNQRNKVFDEGMYQSELEIFQNSLISRSGGGYRLNPETKAFEGRWCIKQEKKIEEKIEEKIEPVIEQSNSSAKSANLDSKAKYEMIITTTSLSPANSESFKNAYDAVIKNYLADEAKSGQTITKTATTEESSLIVLPTSFMSPNVASSAASSSCMQFACLQSLLAASQAGAGLSAGLSAVQSQPSSGLSIESILAQLNKAQGGVVAQPAAPSLQLPDYSKLLTSQGMALSGRLQIISTNPIILLDSSHEQLKPEDIIKDKKDDNFEKIAQGIYDGCLEDKYDYLGVQPLCFKDAGALDEVEGIAVLKDLFKQNSCIELEKKDDKGISQLQAVYADCKKEYAKNGKYFNFDLNKDVSLVANSKITVQSADVYKNGIKTSCEKAGEKEEITKVIVIETQDKKTEDLLKDINSRDLKKATKIELVDSLNGAFKNDSFPTNGEKSVSGDDKIRITVKEDKAAIKDGIELNCASILKGRGVATIVTGATVTEKGLRKTKVLNQECFNKKIIASELSNDQKVELLKISIK